MASHLRRELTALRVTFHALQSLCGDSGTTEGVRSRVSLAPPGGSVVEGDGGAEAVLLPGVAAL